jgi:UDP-galactopyranose mutase
MDLVCFSHLRWNFVFQRPQHLMTRATANGRVFFIEEPVPTEGDNRLVTTVDKGVHVAVPHLNESGFSDARNVIRGFVSDLLREHDVRDYAAWFYTPMMLPLAEGLEARAIIYDCMDELSAFKNAPAELKELEKELFSRADMVFTGGRSLYESKKDQHPNVHLFPSSIDVEHFEQALNADPAADVASIKEPKIGFIGVIDERLDIDLLGKVADLRPDQHFVMIGPVVKIDEADLPRRANIHYMGGREYHELPANLAGMQVAMMPFALNESTRFISPTKTPEYLAAGLPVVSTPIRDVVTPYGEEGLVHIAETAEEFAVAVDQALEQDLIEHRRRSGEFLSGNSWDMTFKKMWELITEAAETSRNEMAAAAGQTAE